MRTPAPGHRSPACLAQSPSRPRSKAASTSLSASNRDTVSLQPLFEDEKGEDARPHSAALTKICPNLTGGIPVSRTARLLRVGASAHVSLQVGGEPILERQNESPLAPYLRPKGWPNKILLQRDAVIRHVRRPTKNRPVEYSTAAKSRAGSIP